MTGTVDAHPGRTADPHAAVPEAHQALGRLRRRARKHWLALEPRAADVWLDHQGLVSIGLVPGELPAAHRQLLQRHRRRTLAANLHHVERFQALARALGDAGIPCCPLKGIHLLGTLYWKDPEHRPMADVDVLVPAESLDEAVAVLERELGLTETPLSRSLAATSHERVLTAPGLVVEVHRHLGLRSGRAVGWTTLVEQGVLSPGELLEVPVHRLTPAAVVVHLLSHFVQHGPWSRLVRAEDPLRWAASRAAAAGAPSREMEIARCWGVATRIVAAARALRAGLGLDCGLGLPQRAEGFRHPLLMLWETLVAPARGAHRGRRGSRWQRNLGLVLLSDDPASVPRVLARRRLEGRRRRASRPESG